MANDTTTERQQRTLLRETLRRNAGTVFGGEHGFTGIRAPSDYQSRVPLQKWTMLEPYVDRIRRGEPGVLTAEPVVMFHLTNGTTGKNKFIPVTARCVREQTRNYRVWVNDALRDNPALLGGRVAGVVSFRHVGNAECGLPFGYVSGNVYTDRMPARVRRRYAYPYDALSIPDPEARRYTLMRLALQHDCSFIFTGNPGALLLLFELADRESESILRDIHDGTLACKDRLPPEILDALQPCLRAKPRRARRLAAVRNPSGRLRPLEYWPGLALVACWLAGTVGRFSLQLPQWIGDRVPLRDVGYMSSEGTFSIPAANHQPAGLLALNVAFYEFIPALEFGRPDAPVLLAHEVEEGGEYQILLTTTGGLYRYVINDIVRVTGRHGGVPMIQFLHKGENVKNIAGEMLNADQVLCAVAAVSKATGFTYRHLQVKADLECNRYVFHFEPLGLPAGCTAGTLAAALEQALGRASEMYLDLRNESAFESCQVRFMRRGWYDALLADAAAKGLRESQFKAALMVDEIDRAQMAE
jgi:hypothetical protein